MTSRLRSRCSIDCDLAHASRPIPGTRKTARAVQHTEPATGHGQHQGSPSKRSRVGSFASKLIMTDRREPQHVGITRQRDISV